MSRFGFCGPSYTSQSPNADDERLCNLYLEQIEGQGKSQFALYPFGGLKISQTLSDSPVRAFSLPFAPGFLQIVSGTSLYIQQAIGGTTFGPNALINDGFPAQLVLPSGATAGAVGMSGLQYFVYESVGHTLTFPTISGHENNISNILYCQGFYVATVNGTNQFYVSSALAPETWPGANTALIQVFPDAIIGAIENQGFIWFFGRTASCVYYLSGNTPVVFDYQPGSLMEQGCIARFSVAKLDNSVFWIGQDSRGYGMVWRANGYTPQRVSNHAVEFAMQSYATITDAVAYTFQDQGHSFYQVNFPSANDGRGATWVYDVATGNWAERTFLDPADGKEYMHRSQCHTTVEDETSGQIIHIVGDPKSGNVYQMKIPTYDAGTGQWDFADDFGNPLQRIRRSPYISTEKEWIVHREFQLDMETGLGPIPGIATPSLDTEFLYLQTPLGVMKQIYVDDAGTLHSNTSGVPANAVTSTVVINYDGLTFQLKLGDEVSAPQWFQIPTAYDVPGNFPMATNPSKLQTSLYNLGGGGGGGGHAVGVTTPVQDYRGPEVILRWSDDSGHLWKYNLYQDTGAAGAYNYRPRFSRLGRSRQRIYEVTWTDAVPFRIVDAYVKADQDYTPQKRLVKKLAETA
jgi:hypothetical protein